MAAAILSTAAVEGQIVYTDVDPDFTFDSASDLFLLDLNEDGQPDFFLFMLTNSYPGIFMGVAPYGSLGSVNASTGSSGAYFYPIVNHPGDLISAGDLWQGYVGGFMTMASASYYFIGSYGNWFDITDGYLGLKLISGGSQYYGWARFDASADGSVFILKDYAYNSVAEESVCIGDSVGPADDCLLAIEAATWIGNLDIADNGNGLDLGFSFNQSTTESEISEYRVIAVKSAAAGSFNLALAETMSGDQVVSIAPTGALTYSSTCVANSTDSDGDPITYGVTYKLFVYCVSANYPSVLSGGSIDITLSEPVGIESNALFAGVSIWPNPTTDFLMIDLTQVVAETSIRIYNSQGAIVNELNTVHGIPIKVNTENLPAGNYFVQLSDGVSRTNIKFIRQ